MEDVMKQRLYRLRRTLKTCDDWQVPILKEEIEDLESYLEWRKNHVRNH